LEIRGNSLIACAEAIDRLITVDAGGRGVIGRLYQAARALSSKPLVLMAAEELQHSLSDKEVVFIATGWPDRTTVDLTIAETDGPSGAAILARTIHRAFGVIPILLTEEQLVPALREVVASAGFKILPPESVLRTRHSKGPIHAATVLPFPISLTEAQREAKRLFELYSPGAVVVIEKGGMNESGVIYSCRGEETTETIAKADQLVIEARAPPPVFLLTPYWLLQSPTGELTGLRRVWPCCCKTGISSTMRMWNGAFSKVVRMPVSSTESQGTLREA
jgi:hypothetical protein